MAYTNLQEINGKKLRQLLDVYCKDKGITKNDLAEHIGFSRCFFNDAIREEKINRIAINYLNNVCGIQFEQYAKEMSVPEPAKTETLVVEDNISYKEIISKLDDLINAVNKLGNIEMQQLDYLKDIKNKSNGYVKPIVK